MEVWESVFGVGGEGGCWSRRCRCWGWWRCLRCGDVGVGDNCGSAGGGVGVGVKYRPKKVSNLNKGGGGGGGGRSERPLLLFLLLLLSIFSDKCRGACVVVWCVISAGTKDSPPPVRHAFDALGPNSDLSSDSNAHSVADSGPEPEPEPSSPLPFRQGNYMEFAPRITVVGCGGAGGNAGAGAYIYQVYRYTHSLNSAASDLSSSYAGWLLYFLHETL